MVISTIVLLVNFVPGISGARDVVTALCEENDRLKAANEELAVRVISGQAPTLRDEERRAMLDESCIVLPICIWMRVNGMHFSDILKT